MRIYVFIVVTICIICTTVAFFKILSKKKSSKPNCKGITVWLGKISGDRFLWLIGSKDPGTKMTLIHGVYCI